MDSTGRQVSSYLLSGGRVEPPVQNTFIHFKFGMEGVAERDVAQRDGGGVGRPVRRSNSDPASSSRSQSCERSDDSVQQCSSGLHSTTPSEAGEGGLAPQALEPELSQEDYDAVMALDMAIPSLGALHHDEGTCKPCAWNWKPSGCANGRACKFCHSCEPGELKKRKHERVSYLKGLDRARNEELGSSCSRTDSQASGQSTSSTGLATIKNTSSSKSRTSASAKKGQGQTNQHAGRATPTKSASSARGTAGKEKQRVKISL